MDRKVQGPFFFFFVARLTSLNGQPRGELSPSNCVSTRVTVLFERQKCEHGQKLEERNKPQEGSSEHPTIKQEILKSEKEKEKKAFQSEGLGFRSGDNKVTKRM